VKLRSKITLTLSSCFVVSLVLIGIISWKVLYANAYTEIEERASLMLEAAQAMRHYTINEVKPKLVPVMDKEFFPQTVPSYSATTLFEALRQTHDQYTYRETALNPTNLRDRPADWEHDIIKEFASHPDLTEIRATRETPAGDQLYIAHPIRITNAECLTCHSVPSVAPKTFLATYGESNGFGWKMNEVVGAQIASVPASDAFRRTHQIFITLMSFLTAGAVIVVVSLHLLLGRLVIRPITQLSSLCEQVSQGDFSASDPHSEGSDEIASLGRSFTRMKVSLEKAMRMIDEEDNL
jgi:protein-histidine pros-kinase